MPKNRLCWTPTKWYLCLKLTVYEVREWPVYQQFQYMLGCLVRPGWAAEAKSMDESGKSEPSRRESFQARQELLPPKESDNRTEIKLVKLFLAAEQCSSSPGELQSRGRVASIVCHVWFCMSYILIYCMFMIYGQCVYTAFLPSGNQCQENDSEVKFSMESRYSSPYHSPSQLNGLSSQ